MRFFRRTLVTAGVVIGVGCASAPVTRTPVAALEAADALVRRGCYACFGDARGAYQALTATGLRAVAVRRLFELELLVALRERELALDSRAALTRAADLAVELPPAAEAARYLDAVEAIPHERNGWTRREHRAFRRSSGMTAERAAEDVVWFRRGPLSGSLNEYLATAIECTYGLPREPASDVKTPGAAAADDHWPLVVRYRHAICGVPHREALDALRAAEPRFVETSFFLGQRAVAAIADGGDNPHRLVDEAIARFPESPAVTYLAASLQHVVGEWERAIVRYDETLALKPDHEDAWLGRTVALTELKRVADAIDAATRMIDLGLDNLDQAYYWRAYNEHLRGDLASARADIDRARSRRVTEEILTMAGIIEHDQNDIELADRDLRRAREMGRGLNCRAEWYLGSVFVKRETWLDAAETFESAMRCYANDIARREDRIRALRDNSAVDPVFRQNRVAQLNEEIRIQRRQHHASAFNAANFHAHSGNFDEARSLVDIASEDPELGAEVDALRRHLAAVEASRRASGS